MSNAYKTPAVADLGSVADLTQAMAVSGNEDGMSKLVPLHHSLPVGP